DGVDFEGKPQRVREIVFLGTIDDAAELLSSASHPAATLGARRLLLAGSEAVDPIAELVRKRLTETELAGGQARQQQNSIALLAILARSDDAARRAYWHRLDELISAIEQGTAPPRWPDDFEHSQFRSINAPPDANHSLAWLVEGAATSRDYRSPAGGRRWGTPGEAAQGDRLERELMEQFGDRLTRLRDRQSGVWRRELQLALDLAQLDERRELAGLARANGSAKLLVSKSAGWVGGSEVVAWSRDGKQSATVGEGLGQVWNTADWTVKAAFPVEGASAVAFSKDNRSLFLAGDGVVRVECATGRVIQKYDDQGLGVADMQLSAEQDVMVARSYHGNKLFVWQLPEGRLIREIEAVEGEPGFALRPDGKVLVQKIDDKNGWLAQDVLGDASPVALKANGVQFAPDGRLFVHEPSGDQNTKRRRLAWHELPNDGGFARLPARASVEAVGAAMRTVTWLEPRAMQNPYEDTDIPTAPGEGPAVRVVSEPEGKELACFEVHGWSASRPDCLVLSPDGSLLAIGMAYEPVRLFRVPSGERLLPGETHVGEVERLRFSSDGKTLVTLGDDGREVTWDAATLKPLGVVPRRAEAAGRSSFYEGLVSEDGTERFTLDSHLDYRMARARIVVANAASGKELRRREIELPWSVSGEDLGLVPGGQYLYLDTQIYDRQTLEMVAGRRLHYIDVRSMVFSADGSRYAFLSTQWGERSADGHRRGEHAVRVQETLSGKTIAYHETGDHEAGCLAFSPDGKGLAFLAADNTLRILPLP
ncbi:MAG TPA: WD40 repeat domain-containing protein, partial [Pirellulales bacterium]|nr:WD40 repeat domain-containing protein [Pirellulales bacterium]